MYNFNDYNFKMTPSPEFGAIYRVEYSWFWRTLQYLTATLNAWVSDVAHKRATYIKLRGPEDGIRIDKDAL
jgi:hypothetical protein